MALSTAVLRAERAALTVLMGLLVLLILLNVVTRYSGTPIYWVDEAAVFTMVWLTFVGASVMTRLRMDFAVGLVSDYLPPGGAKVLKVIATLCVLVFALALVWMCWLWMDPRGIAAAGFNAKDYAEASFNFIYTERTQTLEWPTWVLQLILPIFSLTLIALTNACTGRTHKIYTLPIPYVLCPVCSVHDNICCTPHLRNATQAACR